MHITCYCKYKDVSLNGTCQSSCGTSFDTVMNNVTWEKNCVCNTSKYVLSADGQQCLSACPTCEKLGSSRQCVPMTTCNCLNKTSQNGVCVDQCRVNFVAVMNTSEQESYCTCNDPNKLVFNGTGCFPEDHKICLTSNLTFNGEVGNLTDLCPFDSQCIFAYRPDWGISANVCAIFDIEAACTADCQYKCKQSPSSSFQIPFYF